MAVEQLIERLTERVGSLEAKLPRTARRDVNEGHLHSAVPWQNSSYTYAVDAQANDSYAITLDPAPAAYVAGQIFSFKANTANTGACTLNVNGLGAIAIKKLHDQDTATGDIEAGQIVTVVYDGTNFQMQSQLATAAATVHTLLDASVHSDTAVNTPTRGSLIKANSTPKWDEFNVGEEGQFLRADGTDLDWDGIKQNDVRGQGGLYLGHSRTESTPIQCAANQVNVFGPYKLLVDMVAASGWAQLRITAATGTCRMVIYQDNGSGVPSALIDTSDEITVSDTSAGGSWLEFPFTTTPPSLSAGTSYWIGLISNSSNIQMGMTTSASATRLVTDVGHRLDTSVTYPTPDDPFTDNSNTARVGACYIEGRGLAASDAVAGVVELATAAETTTGTDATRAVTPDGLAGSDYGIRVVEIVLSDPNGDALTTGDGKAYFRVPAVMNGYNLVGVAMAVSTVSSSGIPTVQLRRSRRASATTRTDADMLSTKVTVDASEFDSEDAAAAAAIDTSNDDVQTGDHIFADVDVAGTGVKGALVETRWQLP